MKIIQNVFIAAFSVILFFGGLEAGFRLAPHSIKTYYDEQTERALGSPVPQKEKGEYRIFLFGGSSAYGFPVADRYSITAWLRKSFTLLLPEKPVKVVNCGWPGKGSQYVVEGVRAVLKYKPDLYIIYSGSNDFPISNRLFTDNLIYRLHLQLSFRSAFYRFLDNRLNRVRKKIVYGHSGYPEKYYREEVIAKKFYKKTTVDDEEDRQIIEQHSKNMQDIARFALEQGVDVIFLSVPSNIRDIPPGDSTNREGLNSSDKTKWQQWFEQGQTLEKEKRFVEAIHAYQEAQTIDPTHAGLEYRLAIIYEMIGDYVAAKKAYTLAGDFDREPTRAKSKMNETIRQVSEKYGFMFVDIVSIFEKLSSHGIITSEFIYDDVHPTVKAQQIIVDEILRTLMQKGKIAPPEKWDWQALDKARETPPTNEEWKAGEDFNDYRVLLRGLHLWGQGNYSECVKDLQKSLEETPKFIEAYAFLADAYLHLNEIEKAQSAFKTLDEKDPSLFRLLLTKYPEIQESYSKVMKGMPNAVVKTSI